MTELNIGGFTNSTTYKGSVGTTDIDNLYKFNINSPGSFQISLNGLSGNADISVLNKASAIIKSSSSIEGLSAGEYTIQVLPISGDIKYTLNLAELNSPKKADADILTGTKLETASPLAATILPVVSTSEKPTATKDAITGTLVQENAVVAADKIAATDKPATTLPATTTDKPVTTTSTTTEKPATILPAITTSTTTEKPVTATSTTTEKSATTTSTTSAVSTTSTTTEKPVIATSTTTSQTTTEKPATTLPATTTSTTTEKPVTATPTTTDKPATTTSTISVVSTTSTTTEKPVTTTSTTTDKPATTTSTISAVSTTTSTTTDKPVTTTSTTTTISTTTDKPLTTASDTTTTDKPVTTTSQTTSDKPPTTLAVTESAVSTTSTTDKLVTTTSQTTTDKPATTPPATASAVATTSTTTDKLVTTTSQTTTLPATTTAAATTAVTKDPITGDTVATQETKTGTPLTADKPVVASLDASKPAEKPNTATSNAEETKKETTTALPATETKKEPEPTTDKKLTSPFTSGIFTTDQTGRISVDYTFDGGFFQGELAVFSLEGLEKFEPGSEAFIKEVAGRSLSNSVKGHVVINDATEGARFSGFLGESNVNEGVYLGVKSFAVTAGGKYGVMLVPSGSVKSVFDNPNVGGTQRPLFSMAMANPVQGFNFGQIADVTGEGNTFVMEDMRLDAGSDKDYNDIIFQVRGATAKAALLDTVINPDKEWRKTDLGKALIAYAKPYITPEPKPKVDAEVSDLLDDLEKEILKPVTSDKETPKTPSPTPTTGKDADDSKEPVRISIPPSKTEEKAKDSASNGGDLTKFETSDKVDTKPINAPTTAKDTVADSTEKLPVEKTPVPPVVIEVKDKVTEVPTTETLPAKSTVETEVVTTTPIQKVETKPEVLPSESKVKEESKPVVTEVKDKVTEVAVTGTSPVKSVTDKEVVATIPTQKVETKSEVLPVGTPAKEESKTVVVTEVKDTVTEVAVTAILPVKSVEVKDKVTEVAVTETLPVKSATEKEVIAMTPTQKVQTKPEVLPVETPVKYETLPVVSTNTGNDVNADWIARLESIKQRLSNLGSADVVEENAIDRTSIARLEAMTEKLREQTGATSISDHTAALISRLEEMVVQVAPQPVETVQFEFPKVAQPLVGIFNENGFSQDNPKIDYSRITLAKDRVENDANPLVSVGEGNNPDSAALAIFEQINKNALLVVGRAPASSEEWAKSLIEYVDTAKTSGQPNAIASLNLNLTEVKKDGSITPRYELTKAEKDALAYAQKYNVLVVVPAGDDRETMSALGEISLEFDNIMTVGAAKRVNDSVAASKAYDFANTSGSGYALDILADGSSGETFNTSVAANKVAGAASQVWAANPKLSYRQVVDIIQRTATDLNTPNWDFETGSGLLNIPAAVNLAKITPAIDTDVPIRWLDVDKKNQPLIGIIDTGFNGKNPDIDYKRIILGRDRVDNDNDPLLSGEGSEHGTHVLGIIGATQGNGIGINGINDDAPIWLGRAIGSGKWAESLREFVDAAKASGQPKAVVNLSFDLTQTNPDGSVTTRYELTPQERQAIEYARQNGVMIVVAAGNNGGTMSALGQASQEFDNIITVGSINYNGDRADYSSFGYGLDFVARGGTPNEQVLSTIGEGVNLKQMTSDEEPPEDEMSANARTTFEEVFGAFSDGKESENDEQELQSLTPEERQVYDEATKEIDQLLKDYLGAASEKIALEYVDGYYGASVDALSKFVDAFDEDLADNLIKAQEILEEAGFKTDTPTETNLDFSIPLDLGIGEMAGTSVAAAKVTGAVSQVWAANPGLSYFQVKEILKQTAVDLNKPGWDLETGSGLVNIAAAVELAKRIQPQAYQPKPIQSPLTWSGEGKVTPGERAVAVSVPTFTGRLMNAGYVTQTGWLRIRSGPGTNFAEVGLKYPGDATNFDAYENNGGSVPDPSMPGGGSSRWYKIAGTNNWMSALYIDNTPERAAQERQQQDAIRRAEEDARRAEQEVRRAEEDARRAEDELRRLEAEQRRAQEEARRRAEEEARRRIEEELRRILEEQRRRQEQLQAAISQVTQKVGDLGKAIGSYVNNGVTVYQTEKGILLVQPDGSSAFYEAGKKVAEFFDPTKKGSFGKYVVEEFWDFDKPWSVNVANNFSRGIGDADKIEKLGKFFAYPGFSDSMNGFVMNPPRFGNYSKYVDDSFSFFNSNLNKWDEFIGGKTFANPGKNGFVFKTPGVLPKRISELGKSGIIGGVLGFVPTAWEYFQAKTDEEKGKALIKGGAGSLGSMVGGSVGATLFAPILPPAGAIVGGIAGSFLGGYLGEKGGELVADNWPSIRQNVDNAWNATTSFFSNAVEAAKAKAQGAKAAATAAKAAYQIATTTVQQANAAYQTFTQEVKKQTTQIVQQSQQKLKEAAQKVINNVVNKVAQNPVVQQVSKVAKQVANYAQKAVKTVGNIINGAKQFVNNVIDTGKQFVNNVIDTGKKAYQEVKNFVANTYETGKKVATETYNKAAQAVNTVTNAVSNGFNAAKSLFRW